MKTILHISKYYYPFNGGIESVARQLTEGLTGYRHVVICFADNRETTEELVNGVKVYRIGVRHTICSQAIAPGYGRHLRRLIRALQPDMVHLHAPNPFVYPLLLEALPPKTMLLVHWHSDILQKGVLYRLIRPLEQLILRRADLVVTTSPVYASFSQPLSHVPGKVRILPNGVITEDLHLRPGDEKRITAIRQHYQNKPIVLFVGRHIPYKGLEQLIRAERYIKQDVQILIAGSGPETESYRRMAAGCDRITFLGRLSANDIRRYYHAADIFAFPSVYRAEAFGVALAEAMYAGAVPVTFTIPGSGVNWVSIADETGIEVPLRDAVAFAGAIDALVADPSMREQYAAAARRRVEQMFTDDVVLAQARKIYEEII